VKAARGGKRSQENGETNPQQSKEGKADAHKNGATIMNGGAAAGGGGGGGGGIGLFSGMDLNVGSNSNSGIERG
jgi:hypothetical protein